ncbi:hypothetical protein [Psychrobacter celer]|uniref:hypothetical protein n=1 Tax=Psychrobacter celer TaxID=306572 RepID=UPI003FD6028B
MRTLPLYLVISFGLLSIHSNAASTFDQSWLKKGVSSTTCYHNPCTVTRIMDFQVTKNRPNYKQIKLKAVNGYKEWDSKKIMWDHDFYDIYANCSLSQPNLAGKPNSNGTILPLGVGDNSWVPGAMYPNTHLYLQVCHSYDGDIEKGGEKFGYNIK